MVGLLMEHPRFKQYKPWVALLFTDQEYRNKGYGAQMLKAIEKVALEQGYSKIYLFTSTAEQLYLKEGWEPMERVTYRLSDNVVMRKHLIGK